MTDERVARLGLAAMRIAPDLLIYRLLIQGIPVARHRLDARVLADLGEPFSGAPMALSERLALRVEAVREIDPALMPSTTCRKEGR